nr:MAG TPA: hypothetical protein [Caudoviricetes sp.]
MITKDTLDDLKEELDIRKLIFERYYDTGIYKYSIDTLRGIQYVLSRLEDMYKKQSENNEDSKIESCIHRG